MKQPRKFFDHLRPLFGGFKQSQVDGLNLLLQDIYFFSVPTQAYMLATVFHETAKTMKPIHEYGRKSYFSKYEFRKDLGNVNPGDGYLYRGRGYVMITGRANYTRFSSILNIDLVNFPDKALEHKVASTILTYGCMNGTFTGVGLPKYLSVPLPDYVNARRVVNGLDDAALIAGYARQFEGAIYAGAC